MGTDRVQAASRAPGLVRRERAQHRFDDEIGPTQDPIALSDIDRRTRHDLTSLR